jgi:Sulfotransferase domain
MDNPGSLFADETTDAHPEAKVVVNMRDMNTWSGRE